jgi:hypothetical protein
MGLSSSVLSPQKCPPSKRLAPEVWTVGTFGRAGARGSMRIGMSIAGQKKPLLWRKPRARPGLSRWSVLAAREAVSRRRAVQRPSIRRNHLGVTTCTGWYPDIRITLMGKPSRRSSVTK